MDHCDYDTLLRRLSAPRRNHFFYGKRMDVQHFQMEQNYGKLKQWLLNRLALGKGVLCGLEVVAEGDKLCVEPGVAIDGYGREILVPHRICLDPWEIPEECGRAARHRSKDERHQVTLSLCYRECLTDYAPVQVSDCHTKEACAPDTTVETYHLDVRDGWPKPDEDLCAKLKGDAHAGEGNYRIVATVPVGGHPTSMAASNDGRRVVVAVDDKKPRAVVIEVGTETVIASFSDALVAPLGGACVAPEGGHVFIAHARGVAAYDIESTPPEFLFNMAEGPYGACVANNFIREKSKNDEVVYAINNETHQVDQIDVATRAVVRQIEIGENPNDLWSSKGFAGFLAVDHNSIIFYASFQDAIVQKIDTGEPVKTMTAFDISSREILDIYYARSYQVTRSDIHGKHSSFTIKADPVDSAITTNGQRYYVVNRDPDTRSHELVVFNSEDMKEIARLQMGENPHSVAIVPNRWRAYVSNAADGTVTVVDVNSLSDRLCQLAASCGVPEDPCVVLVTLDLLPGGTIGPLDMCTFRTRLYSNAMLLDMILCLAERIDECCGGSAQPTDNSSPPAVDFLKVKGVEMLSYTRLPPIALKRPDVTIPIDETYNKIRVRFNRPVAQESVISENKTKASFLVLRQADPNPAAFVKGMIEFEDQHTMLYTVTGREGFKPGDYTVTLFGDETPPRMSIRDLATNTRLDGEPLALPSGNGVQGGNFVFKFRMLSNDEREHVEKKIEPS